MTEFMLANYCSAWGYEPTGPKVWVTPREEPTYRGEVYVEPFEKASAMNRAELVNWAPNTVVVRASSTGDGHVVLNRNWSAGWVAGPPYQAEEFHGLIAARLAPGEHTIRFSYRPAEVPLGASITAASLALATGMFIRARRKDRAPPEQHDAGHTD